LIEVEDAVAALACCGRWVRRRQNKVKWIAITGSTGKTTTKELLAEGLSTQFRVHRTPGNFNNHLGVPLTLLACPDDTEVAVLELGMSAAGEIAELTRMSDPDVGLVTNVRAAHLESFGSLDDIAAAKGEVFAVMRDDAVTVVNVDDMHLRVQAARHDGRRVTFGQNPRADLHLEDVQNRFFPGAGMSFRYRGELRRVALRIGGGHSALNALAALAGVVAAGGDLDAAVEGMQRLEAGPGRGSVHRLGRGMMLVDDSYNSNPAAVASVLETLRQSDPPGRKVLVLGDMLELGHLRGALHREAGKRAAAAGVQVLIAVGPEARATAEVARRCGVPEVYHHANASKAANATAEMLKDGDLIVVKGSRGMHLERVAQALISALGEER
jgi:UDP-N-acetylmuramoyl-tripeptide--D-alanyl-D-alanine ligase